MESGRGRPATHRSAAMARRSALLEAAVAVIGERGVAGATHRAIAERAGVARSNTTYFFASIDELVIEAFEMYADRRAEELIALSEVLGSQQVNPDEFIAMFVAVLLNMDRAMELTGFEAYIYAAREPALREAVARGHEAFIRAAVTALGAVGVSDPERGGLALFSLIDGFTLHHLSNPETFGATALGDALTILLRGLMPAGGN